MLSVAGKVTVPIKPLAQFIAILDAGVNACEVKYLALDENVESR